MATNNLLLYNDNIEGMQWLLNNGYAGKIDLCNIDPPFATGGKFSIDTSGRAATISSATDGILAYKDTLQGNDFIEYLRKRIVLIHQLLSDKGSLYLHIDYKMGHYVKVMLDSIFGIENFRNEITRIKCNPKNFDRIGYGNIKDVIFFYTKGKNPIWNNVRTPYTEKEISKFYSKIDKNGRRYTTVPIHAREKQRMERPTNPLKVFSHPKVDIGGALLKNLKLLTNKGSLNGLPMVILEKLTMRMK